MAEQKTSVFNNALIWFGAAVSIAEIITGTYLAPLGMSKGILAILAGHLTGCFLLFLAGYIGAKTRLSSMDTVAISFGSKGNILFAILNVLQLFGWTSIMIYDGAHAANEIFKTGTWFWALIIGILIVVWIFIGIEKLGIINKIAITTLFILTIILSFIIFKNKISTNEVSSQDALSFGAAFELSIAMPLSWFPLISDYTRRAKKPFAASFASSLSYGIVSCWMFIIGMGAALFAGITDISVIMLRAGLGIFGLIIVVFSTVTTTFMDAYSAGLSSVSVSSKIKEKIAAIITAVLGTIFAIIYPMDKITDFLYLIGSVFAPMVAVLIADYYIVKSDFRTKKIDFTAIIIWLIGFIFYRFMLKIDCPLGSTIPDMLVTMILTILARLIVRRCV